LDPSPADCWPCALVMTRTWTAAATASPTPGPLVRMLNPANKMRRRRRIHRLTSPDGISTLGMTIFCMSTDLAVAVSTTTPGSAGGTGAGLLHIQVLTLQLRFLELLSPFIKKNPVKMEKTPVWSRCIHTYFSSIFTRILSRFFSRGSSRKCA
jgi:hypothetical protein